MNIYVEINLSSSNPISSLNDDNIGLDNKVNLLTDLLNRSSTDSLRVAIFGEWGVGKTSLVKIVEASNDIKENFSFLYFSPWLYSNENDAISAMNAEVAMHFSDTLKKIKKNKNFFNTSKKGLNILGSSEIPNILQEYGFPKLSKATGVLINLFKSIAFSKDRMKKVIENSGTKFVFVIEDLDRCEGNFLHSFLLYVREVLDINNVTTILIADYKKLGKKIDGEIEGEFSSLEKFYDTPIYMTFGSREIASNFILKSKNNPFSEEVLNKYTSLLPVNPRFLNKFCTHIGFLKKELERFDESEIYMETMFLIHLLKIRLPSVYYFFLEKQVPMSAVSSRKKGDKLDTRYNEEDKRKNIEESFKKISNDKGVKFSAEDTDVTVDFLYYLLEKVSFYYEDNFFQYGEILEKKIIITKKEMKESIANTSLNVESFKKALEEYDLSSLDLVNVIIYLKTVELEKVIDEPLINDKYSPLATISSYLNILYNLISANYNGIRNISTFKVITDHFRQWDGVLSEDITGEFKGIVELEKKIIDEFYFDTNTLSNTCVLSLKVIKNTVRIRKGKSELISHLKSRNIDYRFAVTNTIINEVIESRCNCLNDSNFMARYSDYLDQSFFIEMLYYFEKVLTGELQTEVVFNYFKFIHHRKSLVFNYITDYSTFISDYQDRLQKLINDLDKSFLSPWSIVLVNEFNV